ncbi:hypothetical protein [Bartonella sp. HY038]|uniref:hypothetical protein n=1 Tax=Bartonella sp. HY038 TaxID=2759660 RepID=UPI0015FA392E|nr:hypothetical protein [Bartonella sp. HY038]
MINFMKIYCLSFFISIMVLPIASLIYLIDINDYYSKNLFIEAVYPFFLIVDVYLPIINLILLICVALPLYKFFKKVKYQQTLVIFIYTQVITALSFLLTFIWGDYLHDSEAGLLGFSFITSSIMLGLLFGAIFKWLYIDFYGEGHAAY